MGRDVYMFTDEEYTKEKGYAKKGYEKLKGKDTGATGYLRNPPYGWGSDGPIDVDFLGDTPNVLDHLLNLCLVREETFMKYLNKPKELLINTNKDPILTVNSLNEVKEAVIKMQNEKPDDYNEKYIELIDFYLLGIELQLAGKHPKVLVA